MNPKTGTFYKLKNTVVFSPSDSTTTALDHHKLFPAMLNKVFPDISRADMRELCLFSMYSIPRGRVTRWKGSLTLFAGAECRWFEATIRNMFGLHPDEALTANYADAHYVTANSGRWLINDVMAEQSDRLISLPDAIKIKGTLRRVLTADQVHIDDPRSYE